MSTYRMSDGTVVKSEKATAQWKEATRFDGHNQISCATGSQWEHQRLYRSRKGRYWLEHYSDWQGKTPYAEWLSPEEAARWLMAQEIELPDDLKQYEADLTE